MNQFEINQFSSNNNFVNYIYSPSFSNLNQKEMDNNFWCVDVPDNMPDAFNVVQNNLNQSSDSLFRFTGSTPNTSFTNLNSSSPANFDSKITAQPTLSNNNWKTINNLHEASNLIGPYKRKNFSADDEDDLIDFQPPNKQNATEEKVIGIFNKLSIDEEFNDCSDELFLAINDYEIDDDLTDGHSSKNKDDLIETDEDILNDNSVQFELADEVQEFWDTDDVITKLVKNEREKNSKALVLWQPRILKFPSDKEDECNKETKIVDQTDEYTVIEEPDDIKIEEDIKQSSDDAFKLEIIELNDDSIKLNETGDEDMMEL